MDEIELQGKIGWLDSMRQYYEQQSIEFNQTLGQMERGEITSREKEAVEFKIIFSDKMAEMLRWRINEVNLLIEFSRSPDDSYLQSHAGTLGSDTKLSDLSLLLSQLENAAKSTNSVAYNQILAAKSEIAGLVQDEHYTVN